MICTSCGTTNRDDAQFCRGCGTALTSPPSPPSSSSPLPSDPPPASYPGYQSQYPPSQASPIYNPSYGSYQAPLPAGASGKAVASLILGVLSIVTCLPLFSIPAMILGKMEMTAIAQTKSPQAGLGYAKAGFWIGLVTTILLCGGFIIAAAFGFLGSILGALGNIG